MDAMFQWIQCTSSMYMLRHDSIRADKIQSESTPVKTIAAISTSTELRDVIHVLIIEDTTTEELSLTQRREMRYVLTHGRCCIDIHNTCRIRILHAVM